MGERRARVVTVSCVLEIAERARLAQAIELEPRREPGGRAAGDATLRQELGPEGVEEASLREAAAAPLEVELARDEDATWHF